MKNGLNKKIIILLGVFMLLILTGFGFWENVPHLINSDKPFIDLSGSIGDSIGSANKAYEKDILSPVPTEVIPTNPPEPTDVPDVTEPEKAELKILVGDTVFSGAGEKISVAGLGRDLSQVNTDPAEGLKNFLKNEDLTGVTVILVDNYAEVKAYREVERMLVDLGIEFHKESIR